MKFYYTKRRRKANRFALFIISFVVAVIIFLYTLNARLMPTYLQYAEVQTFKIASHVVSKAINARTSTVLDVNEIIEDLPSESDYMLTTRFNTEIINKVRAETVTLVKEHLQLAEQGDLTQLPDLENVEYDISEIQKGDGIVFFVPIAQALNLPLLGNLGPRVPIRFHIIGNVASDVATSFKEFGINNALVEVNIHIKVNVQIIIPFASKQSSVEQTIPVAIGLVRGQVPHIYTNGGDGAQPSIEVPVPLE
ncbi:sporulation protein YunB [Lysinibacillus endophyticus]|uniref:Sporulation protein YunB n=1 Tax=Ureibacillus endophyticus TaxID=1978490 RepID=A0A494Z480_9BACL|nr:sporulation protein YunB [Lysinibacillus endophyticus]MCP1145695.1 sporulation protein YunB [Lysinibacillus endophyticus]RKQ17261.1 sporulation protein YunB [Lysinibacillus endophyticus]